MAVKKYLSYDKLQEYDALIKGEIDSGDSSALANAKSYTDTKVSGITSGSTVVAEATHAVSADSATKATQDASGNVITSTYETKTDASAKLAEAKSYTDTEVAKKADSGHTHSAATQSANGFMSSTDKTKLDGIAEGANKTTVDSALSSTSTNPVQNKVINSALSGKVPTTRTVNGKALSANITLSASDVGADATGSADTALTSAKAYTDEKVAALVNGAPETLDTLDELAAALNDNADILDVLNDSIGNKADKTSLESHTGNTTVHITSTERTNWNTAYTHSQVAHAPSDAEKNQNAFSNVTVGSTTVAADSATDTLTLVAGTNVTITADATNDKITISSTDTNTTYSAGTGISLSGTTFSNSGVRSIATGTTQGAISVNTNGTTTSVPVYGLGTAAYAATTAFDAAGAANTALTNAKTYTDEVASGKSDTGHSHSDATTSSAGFMTAAMVTKLNGIATGATKVTVDSALSSSSTNPVQNKVVNSALSTLTSTVTANTSSINSHTTSISNLQTAVSEIQEITSEEIQALFA